MLKELRQYGNLPIVFNSMLKHPKLFCLLPTFEFLKQSCSKFYILFYQCLCNTCFCEFHVPNHHSLYDAHTWACLNVQWVFSPELGIRFKLQFSVVICPCGISLYKNPLSWAIIISNKIKIRFMRIFSEVSGHSPSRHVHKARDIKLKAHVA